jgi:vacuolar-type H+-ATPase subunit I/STV1
MRGMGKPLVYVFIVITSLYLVFGYRSTTGILVIVGIVFIGGGLFLTAFAYLCARWSMPRKATDYLPTSDSSDKKRLK